MEHKPPKRPRSGYNFYQLSFLADGSSARHTQHAAKEVSKSWRRLSASEKAPYMSMANFDQNRYAHELIQFEEAMAKKREEICQADTEGIPQSFLNLIKNQRPPHHSAVEFPAISNPRTHQNHQPQPSPPAPSKEHRRSIPRVMSDPSGIMYAPGAAGEAAATAAAASSSNSTRTPAATKRERTHQRNSTITKRHRGFVVQSSEGEVPNMLQSARRLLLASISYRHAELQEVQNSGKRRDLEKIDKLIREIVLCRQQIARQEDDSYEAVILSVTGSSKMQQARIPALFISFVALSLAPVRDTSLVGGIFLVEISWRVGTVRRITRALCAFGSEYRAEMILSTLRPMSSAMPGIPLRVKFLKFIRRSTLKDSVSGLKDQIMLDLWSMGLIHHDSKRGSSQSYQPQHSNTQHSRNPHHIGRGFQSSPCLSPTTDTNNKPFFPDKKKQRKISECVRTPRRQRGSNLMSPPNRNVALDASRASNSTEIQTTPPTPPIYIPGQSNIRATSEHSLLAQQAATAASRPPLEFRPSSPFLPILNWSPPASTTVSGASNKKTAIAREGTGGGGGGGGGGDQAGLTTRPKTDSSSSSSLLGGLEPPSLPRNGVFSAVSLGNGNGGEEVAAAGAAGGGGGEGEAEEAGRAGEGNGSAGARVRDDVKMVSSGTANAAAAAAGNETPTCRQCGVSLMGLPEIVYNDDPTAQDKTFCSRRCRDEQKQKLIEEFVNGLI